jgi:epothilone polyketide synthase D
MAQQDGLLIERLRDATIALRKAQAERDVLEREKVESIAIVGMGCRFPGGADSIEAFWSLLDSGGDAVQPLDLRWTSMGAHPHEDTPRWAGLLTGAVDTFDPAFFGISPREATKMDPQHRLLLEVCWEALEDAGILPRSLDGSDTGMFLGACSTDYQHIIMREPREQRDAYNAIGNLNSVAAGRVSFTLGLQGPCFTVDTACSSSLVAVHLACRSLRVRESSLALVGGVNLIFSRDWMEGLARTQSLSPDGRCRTFDASANGFVRGEGCGVVVLKRLSDAQRDGNRIWATIRGSAVNQDGRSTGLTTPNVLAQAALLREALKSARVDAGAIGYIETHGTGTSIGDPIEVEALRAVVGPLRPDGAPSVLLGAVKTNVGHLEAAAGVAGLIKTVLVLDRERIPRNLNFRTLNPRIRLEGTALALATESTPWPRTERPRFAGVSSFGLSGTNAHVVLEEAPFIATRAAMPERAAELLVLSGRTEKAVNAQAAQLCAHLRIHPELAMGDVAFSLATTRSAMEHRLTAVASSRDGLIATLEAAGRGESPVGTARAVARLSHRKTAFLFPGQGAQVPGMGRGLCEAWPAFKEALERCATLFDLQLERPLRAVMWAEQGHADAALLDQTAYTQPALFAMEYALHELWCSWGVTPAFVAGHSIGELVAACVAGVFSLEDAVRLVAARGRLMQALPACGAMVSIAASELEIAAAISGDADRVSIAAINGPKQIVIAGVEEAVDAVAAGFAARGVRVKRLNVSHAFHSPLMDSMLDAFELVASTVKYQRPSIALVSNLTGKLVSEEVTVPAYWVRHVRDAVRFADGIKTLCEAGVGTFIEVGPRSTLLGLVPACLPEAEALLVPSLRRGRAEAESVLEAVGGYWGGGHPVAWNKLFPGSFARVSLPTYPWQRERHWVDLKAEEQASISVDSTESGYYQLSWPVTPREEAASQRGIPGAWLVMADRGGVGEAVAASLDAEGCSSVLVHAPADNASDSHLQLAEALGRHDAWQGVVYLWGLDAVATDATSADEMGEITLGATAPLLALIQALSPFKAPPRLWIVTRGACAVSDGASVVPCQSALWGLGRIVAQEHATAWGGLVDLDPLGARAEVDALVAELLSPDGEDQLAFRGEVRHAARLVAATLPETTARPSLAPEGTYLVTGGLDGPVLHAALWLVQRGARHLLLMSPGGVGSAGVAALEAQGAGVTVIAGDPASAEEMRTALAVIEPPLRGVVHAAGLGPARSLLETDDQFLKAAVRAKVVASWGLHRLLESHALDFFVLFSSAAGVWGSAWHGAVAAGDAFLDGLAHHRRARSLPALSIDWGSWSEEGTADAGDSRLAEMGALPMSTEQALSGLDRLVTGVTTQCVVARVDWARFAPVYAARSGRKLLVGLVKDDQPRAPAPAAAPRRWKGQSADEIRPALLTLVHNATASVLGFNDPMALNPSQGLAEQGLDSLMAVQLRDRLQAELGVPLSATMAFDHPSVERLLAHLLTEVLDLEDASGHRITRTVALDEPIAVIGASCRLPGGADDMDAYWALLAQGGMGVIEVPSARWDAATWYDADPGARGRTYVTKGGFLRDVETFDPTVFRISPREAISLDPQQRLLLEVSWEALERSGYDPTALRESSTGVFIGVGLNEYSDRVKEGTDESADLYAVTGNALSITAGRLSFVLGFHGPSLAVDTACSSSLVALHLACQSLRQGECDAALAGGVNVLLSPLSFVAMSRMGALSVDGQCKTFSAAADGYGRGEGCGVVVLKRLSDARRDGDHVLCVIRGTAINHDGPSSGLTVPNGPAQQAVLRQALTQAAVSAESVDFIECHGTGTSLGDPIEIHALAAVYGPGRPAERPLVLGSAKANLGHLEPAAGIAGLLKAMLAIEHEKIPPQPEFGALNPNLPWATLPVTVARAAIPWPRTERPRYAGVSSFGMSGTNAHVVLEEGPIDADSAGAPERATELVVLSAKSDSALNAQAARLLAHLNAHPEVSLGDVAFSLATTRAAMEQRLALSASSREGLREALASAARGETPPGAARGRVSFTGMEKVVFVFPGQGSQWLGMGRALLAEEPVFRAALEACDAAIQSEAGFSLLAELAAEESKSQLERIDVVQPVLFAVEVALAALWQSWGLKPDAVVGHSMGEVAAAHVAGVLSLEDAVAIICRRSRLLRRISGQGAMALVELPVVEAESTLVGYEDRLSVAVSNSPRFTVLSGDPSALAEVLALLESRGVFCRRVNVDVASHSPQVDPLREELIAALAALKPGAALIPMRSTVTGAMVSGAELSAEYWADNVRQPVRFAQSVQSLIDDGHLVFVEMSPHPILLPSVQEILGTAARDGVAVGSLRRKQDERQTLLESLGTLWVHGYRVAWARQFPAGGRRLVLPTYPWQRERYWIDAPASGAEGRAGRGHTGAHPLLGERQTIATQSGTRVWETTLDLKRLPWLRDHKVQDAVILPGTAYVEMVLTAGSELFDESPFEITDLVLVQVLALVGDAAVPVQVVSDDEQAGRSRFQIASRATGTSWQTHARGALRRVAQGEVAPALDLASLRERVNTAMPPDGIYEALTAAGLVYGPAFRGLVELWRGEREALGRVRLPDAAGAVAAYRLHPALLDSCFHVLTGVFADSNESTPWVPVEIGRVRFYKRPSDEVWCYAKVAAAKHEVPGRRSADLVLTDRAGDIVAELSGLVVQQLATGPARREDDDWFLELDWEPAALPGLKPAEGRWLLLGGGEDSASSLNAALVGRGHRVVRVAESTSSVADLRTQLANAFAGQPPTAIVHLGSLEVADQLDVETVEAALVHGCDSVVAAVQAIAAMGYRDAPRLWLVTRGAQPVRGGDVSAAQSPLLGLGRVIAMEHGELRCARVDLDRIRSEGEVDSLVGELLADDSEEEVAWRGGERYVGRIDRRIPDTERRERVEVAGDRPFRLEIDKPGVLEHLVLRATERRPPGPGEVEIAVQATGLNFADVMQAMGFVFGLNGGPVPLGAECAGRIVALGEGAESFRIGQDVMAFAPFSFGTHVTIHEKLVARRPATLSAAQAAALPVVLMTAWHSLVHVARLRAGERVLIHSATGGTGQAAMQIARHLGAEIFATAGSPEKREWLRAQGVTHVMDSRSLEFAEQVLAATNGQGVDVVFNSLSGAAIEASLSALAPDGRFIEIGKTDIYSDRPLGLGQFKKSLSYSHVDLAGLAMRHPEQVSALLHEIAELLERGVLEPLPIEVFPISRATDAFYKMAQARHLGKLVLTLDEPDVAIRVPVAATVTVRPNGTYLITGGLGGLGLSLAAWLSERGASHLVLVGRSGAKTPVQEAAIASLAAQGTRVTVARADVSNRADVEAVLSTIDASGLPLFGVIHAAGLLEDGLLMKQSPERFRRVMAPKIRGALHLHELTLAAPLDFFVMYSSAAGFMGSPGQANYAAANTFLDSLAHHRRAHGLPALSIDWAAFSEVGLAAAQENRGARIASQGMRSLTPAEGISALERLLDSDRVQSGVVPLDVRQWLEFFPAAASSRMLSRLVSAHRTGVRRPTGDPEVMKRMAAATPEARVALLEKLICKHVSHVLRIPEEKVALKEPLTSLGMDSLMGLELRNRIEASLGVTVPATLLWTYPTVAALSRHLGGDATEIAPPEPVQPARDFAAETRDMSDSEAARMIDQEFEGLQ